MGKPIENEKYGLLCPECKKILPKAEIVTYNEIDNGVFKSSRVVKETNYECKNCGWSYYSREVE